MDLQAICSHAADVARGAGALLLQKFQTPLALTFKKGPQDVVTEADKAAEAYIFGALMPRYPTHHFVGEESGSVGTNRDAAYHWYIDPLDGTTNFVSRIPHFSVSIALTDANARPLVGVVYDPNRDELFTAVKGAGAFLNGVRLQVTSTERLNEAVLATGYPADKPTSPVNNLDQVAYFVPRTRDIRRFGSGALDVCWVAAGRLDGFWEWKLNRWDFLAGLLCVTEAGGIVSDFDGVDGEHLYSGWQVLASNRTLHPQIVAGLQSTL